MRDRIDVRIHDAHLGIWQDNANDISFRLEIFAELLRRMRKRSWSFRADPDILRRYRRLSPSHRLGQRGTLRCAIEISGRVVNLDLWSETSLQVNRNGRRYDHGRLLSMHHLDRLRVELEFRRVIAWLETIAPVTVDRSAERDTPAMDLIQKSYAESWHSDKDLGRPVCQYDYNRRAQGGDLLDHGQTVWFPDRKGRIVRGTAFYHINSMWFVVAGGQLFNESCGCLRTRPPSDLRAKCNDRSRRIRLEAEMATAVRRMQFLRAETLKGILFGDDGAYMIWARDHEAYYRSQYAGYTTDTISAGRYTRAEAEREVRRVPHKLEMVTPTGEHVRFDLEVA